MNLITDKGLTDLYSSVSESSSSEYWVSPLPPARSPRAASSPAAFPYPVYFNRLSTERLQPVYRIVVSQTPLSRSSLLPPPTAFLAEDKEELRRRLLHPHVHVCHEADQFVPDGGADLWSVLHVFQWGENLKKQKFDVQMLFHSSVV